MPGTGLNRRGFLKRTAAAAAGAVGFPYIIPSSALGADGAVAPSERITLGFIGMGKQMWGHLRGHMGGDATQVLAVCDVESMRLARAKQMVEDYYGQSQGGSYTGCAAYKDFRDLVRRDDIDAVVTALPNHWHAITAVEAAKHGKDIYCEKPLARTIAECRAMVDAVRRYGRVFQTGSQQRSDHRFRLACELVRNGRIGRVHTVHVNIGGPPVDCYLPPQPVPEGLDWDFWLGPAPWRPYHADIAPPVEYGGWPNWRSYRDYAGGAMTDWGAHHFDIAQWGLGMDQTGPVEVYPPDGKQFEMLTYRYANGVVMYRGGGQPPAGVEFIGTEGSVRVTRGAIDTTPKDLVNETFGPNEVRLYKSADHRRDWLDCIRSRSKPICDVEIGHHSALVCHIGNIAYWLNRPLKWDPDAERFVNDAEANRLLSRAMRAPWRL